ncbi:hypothetical protein BS47DRAFT_1344723 [Hydnum rufescens UP504]|uniref:Uncharacterized protein n=1 Tax=Hydnum rufescens UP504 TaxID=1448309 RepID=A0A9P6AYC4_9AGAM|nr:hypothetical protein BS47DRAFT_1344723 [Hydnum rufescens UP504]
MAGAVECGQKSGVMRSLLGVIFLSTPSRGITTANGVPLFHYYVSNGVDSSVATISSPRTLWPAQPFCCGDSEYATFDRCLPDYCLYQRVCVRL